MTYQLIPLTGRATGAVIGTYPTYADAVAARADDVYAQLVHNDGYRLRVEHHIVGPGDDGPESVYPWCTELGVDPDRPRPPTQEDLDDDRRWIDAVHDSAT